MKKIFSAVLVGLMAFNGYAATGEIEFSYADENVFAFGKGKTETIDVAMCINDPSLKGMKVTAVKALVNTVEGISEASLWLSNNLTLENKVNIPDIMSESVSPTPTVFSGYSMGELYTTFSEPYVIGDEPVYVGYTINISEIETEGEMYPIIVSRKQNPNGFFLHMSKSVLKWMEYGDKVNGVAEIIVTLEGNLPEYCLGIKNVADVYAEEDEAFKAKVDLSNTGIHPVESLKYSYSFDDDEEIYTGSLNLETPIDPDMLYSSIVLMDFKGTNGIGEHIVHLTIDEIDGHKNDSFGASCNFNLHIIPFKPVHRPLTEEFTGLWCQWCPRGYIGMELLGDIYGEDAVIICYHNGDAMNVTKTYPVNISGGLPCASIDRIEVIDPYYGTHLADDFGISIDFEDRMDVIAVAEINVEAELDGNIVNVNSSVRFIQDLSDLNYQIGYVLVANGLTDENWYQKNAYANKKGYEGTYLQELTEWPGNVGGLIYNDVAIDVSGMTGVAETIPSEVKLGEYYTHQYSFNIEGNTLVQDVNNLVVNAFIVDKNTGNIINANKYSLYQEEEDGVDVIDNSIAVTEVKYYNLAGQTVSRPGKGFYIKLEVLENGKTRASKVYLKD